MKIVRHLGMLLLLALVSSVFAQPRLPQLIISPREVQLQPGQGQRFEAAAFDANGQPVRIDGIVWQVAPDTLGKITEDGFFVAGRNAGKGRILAQAKSSTLPMPLLGEATVAIAPPNDQRVVVVISPEFALLMPEQSEKFHVKVLHSSNVPMQIKAVRWLVRPENFGKIDTSGVFTAGANLGEGVVVAFVETDKGVFNGEAKVTIAARANAAIKGHVAPANADMRVYGLVWAERIGGERPWRGEAKIDSNGNYCIGKLQPGVYVVRAQARGYLPEYYKDARHYTLATPLQVTAGDTLTGIDFNLDKGGIITGKIISEIDNAAIGGAHVFAVHVITNAKYHALTNAEGAYVIEGLPTGNNAYAVFAEAEGYRGEYYENAANLLAAKLLTVVEGQKLGGIDLSLALGSALTGKVVDATNGNPVGKAAVMILGIASPNAQPVRVVNTNEQGEYLASVRPGAYYVAVEARGYQIEFYNGSRDLRNAVAVKVAENQHTKGIDFKLDPLSAISGVVLDQATKTPLAGAVVFAFPERPGNTMPPTPNDAKIPYVAKTDSLGQYKITNVRDGKYFLLAEARGYLNEFWQEAAEQAAAKVVEVKEGGQVANIDFTLEKGGAIAGAVVSAADGAALAGAQVFVWSKTSNAPLQSETARDGKYRVGGLRTGEYLVYVEAKGYKPQFFDAAETRDKATPVKVAAPNETSGINFKLEKLDARRGAIAGIVVSEADGNSLPNAVVMALPAQSGPPLLAFADRMGAYEIKGLLAGKYLVLAAAPQFLAEYFDNVRNWQEATKVEVAAGRMTSSIDFKLTPAPRGAYNISGTLTRGDNHRGESNAIIYAMENGVHVASALPDDRGNFFMSAVPAGEYKIMATGASGTGFFGGSNLNNAQPVSVGNGLSATTVNLTLNGATSVAETKTLPQNFALEQNYPNPFNPATTIPYQLASRSNVRLVIYNALGQEVRTLLATLQEAGAYTAQWDGKDNLGQQMPTGVYLYRLHAGEMTFTKKMIYLR